MQTGASTIGRDGLAEDRLDLRRSKPINGPKIPGLHALLPQVRITAEEFEARSVVLREGCRSNEIAPRERHHLGDCRRLEGNIPRRLGRKDVHAVRRNGVDVGVLKQGARSQDRTSLLRDVVHLDCAEVRSATHVVADDSARSEDRDRCRLEHLTVDTRRRDLGDERQMERSRG